FSLDDRTGNVLTTVALFIVGAAILYLARGAFLILVLSLFFAYLLEPAVTFMQKHSRLGRKSRTLAIAQVYLVGTVVIGILAYLVGPHLVAQAKSLGRVLPEILGDMSSGRAGANLGRGLGLTPAQQLHVQDWIAGHHDSIAGALERGSSTA